MNDFIKLVKIETTVVLPNGEPRSFGYEFEVTDTHEGPELRMRHLLRALAPVTAYLIQTCPKDEAR